MTSEVSAPEIEDIQEDNQEKEEKFKEPVEKFTRKDPKRVEQEKDLPKYHNKRKKKK